MHTLSVTKDPDGESGIYQLPLDHILVLFGESEKKWIVVHTETEMFYMMGTIKYWDKAIVNSGYNRFAKLDRNTIVNAEKVQLLDSDQKRLYFQPNKGGQFCDIVFYKYTKFEQLIKQFNRNVIIQ